jgi:hypothetical protein
MSEDTETTSLVSTRRKVGRPRKSDTTITSESKRKPLLPILKIDFNRDPTEQLLQITDIDQARHLGWKAAEVRSVNSHLGLYESLPMVCQASGCYWATQCPTRPDFKFKGYLCPIEVMDVYKYFLGYVRDLDINPTDYVDLRLVEDLVRIDLQLKRVDQQISINGMEIDMVGGILRTSDSPVWQKGAHPLLLVQDKLRNRRRDIHKALIASRSEKLDRDRKEGKLKEDTLNIFDKMVNQYLDRSKQVKATVKETTESIDAEFTSDSDDEDEE